MNAKKKERKEKKEDKNDKIQRKGRSVGGMEKTVKMEGRMKGDSKRSR